MLAHLYSFNFYKFIKAGLLVDFYSKSIILYFLKNFFLMFSMFFGEKYFIEYMFLRLGNFMSYMYMYLLGGRFFFSIFFLGFSWLILLFIFFLIVLFTLNRYAMYWMPSLVSTTE